MHTMTFSDGITTVCVPLNLDSDVFIDSFKLEDKKLTIKYRSETLENYNMRIEFDCDFSYSRYTTKENSADESV